MGSSEMELPGFKKLVLDKIGESLGEIPFLINPIEILIRRIGVKGSITT